MVAEQSQAKPEDAQVTDASTAAGRQEIAGRAIAAAREELNLPVPEEDAEPQADAGDGTDNDDAPPTDSTSATPKADGGTDDGKTEEEEAPSEPDWSDTDQREAELTKIREGLETEARDRLDNQRRSLAGEFQRERDDFKRQMAETQDNVLLRELDELRESDPQAYAERLNSDAPAARAVANRHSTPMAPEQVNQIRASVAFEQSKQLFAARPELEAMAADGGDEWKKAADPSTDGLFGYIDRTARAEGETEKEKFAEEAVKKFRNSSDFKDAIAEAEKRGRQDALTESGMGSPPSSDDAQPTGGAVVALPKDLKQRSVALAKAELAKRGTPVSLDPSTIATVRRSPARR